MNNIEYYENIHVPDGSLKALLLNRVSDKKQLNYKENNEPDLPMQRIEGTKYAQEHGWVVIGEASEKGVSAYKNLAADRDVLVSVIEEAKKGTFQILIVFMLDRLGRKSFDTPGVVIELARYGVQVWSVHDGYIACEKPEDEVNLFLKCWSAEGESRKTSIRTKARLGQIVEEGHIKGGLCPYGYRYVKDGRVNKRGKELFKYAMNDSEAEIVRLMFYLFRVKAYGPQRISTYLYEEKGITDRSEKKFSTGTIRGILRNILYVGIIRYGDSRSPIIPELQIIPF